MGSICRICFSGRRRGAAAGFDPLGDGHLTDQVFLVGGEAFRCHWAVGTATVFRVGADLLER